ncbi:hypothetical protein BDP27DRAFT_1318477 [Rhodocollybia butyracea]|uniref:Uncharacterized protein n=1 Tax=Rhodocollybia butyracea TaxID=206335 RepID=A0A9P5UCV4_9AGAR|nr:hypothetical protein BDP27DRAFT_1318477 [Rhodocollybia butyracea]
MAENHDSTISLRNTFKRQANQVASIEAIEVDTDTDVNLNTVIHPVDTGFHAFAFLGAAWVLDLFLWCCILLYCMQDKEKS